MLENCAHVQIKKGYLALFQQAIDYAFKRFQKENGISEFSLESIYIFEKDYYTLKTVKHPYINKLVMLYHKPETDEEDCYNLYFEFIPVKEKTPIVNKGF